ncbi:Os03g0686700 [Oryza sativa Japonica Group]|uniref:Os03g0686700 protein n=2 Tax=Oryza sativa subsp. japonica TaxID=39947 RepID=Q0DPI9_ORYSJ|nr:hypothetical protein EE612_019745 [Oryza sativa]BAF12849.1 Os03g0686700 [Oryza sativa Japonica Group]BAS85810.1 Os03g0686700 [Oryza sativa Japonica Group]|eukprot:NP_001050935.1 Os03g0686700 [Oryza sativa Japonica Group]
MKCKVRRGCSSLPRSTPPPIPHSPLAQVGAKGEVRQSASQPPRPLHGRGDTCARLQRSMPPVPSEHDPSGRTSAGEGTHG